MRHPRANQTNSYVYMSEIHGYCPGWLDILKGEAVYKEWEVKSLGLNKFKIYCIHVWNTQCINKNNLSNFLESGL